MKETTKERITWTALEYILKKKSADWFWTFGIIAGSVIIIGILFDNYFFSVAVLLAACIIILFSFRPPHEISFEINQTGVIIEKTLYPYVSLESFWVEEKGVRPKILFISKKKIMPMIAVPLGEVPAQTMRDFLKPLLPEVECHESTSQQILEHLGI